MVAWQIIASVAAVLFPLIGIANAYFLNQIRLELAALKIQILQERSADAEKLRAWVDETFVRKEQTFGRWPRVFHAKRIDGEV